MTSNTQTEVREIAKQWIEARTTLTERQNLARVGLAEAPKPGRQMEEFVAQLNRASQALINLMGIHDPILYEAFMELVVNGRTLVNQQRPN